MRVRGIRSSRGIFGGRQATLLKASASGEFFSWSTRKQNLSIYSKQEAGKSVNPNSSGDMGAQLP